MAGKFTQEQRKEIMRRYWQDRENIDDLANEYGIKPQAIHNLSYTGPVSAYAQKLRDKFGSRQGKHTKTKKVDTQLSGNVFTVQVSGIKVKLHMPTDVAVKHTNINDNEIEIVTERL